MGSVFGSIKKRDGKNNNVKKILENQRFSANSFNALISFDFQKYVVHKSEKNISKNKVKSDFFINIRDYREKEVDKTSNPLIIDGIIYTNAGLFVEGLRDSYEIDIDFVNEFNRNLELSNDVREAFQKTVHKYRGSMSIIIMVPRLGKLLLYSNTRGIYVQDDREKIVFSTDYMSIHDHNNKEINVIDREALVFDIPMTYEIEEIVDKTKKRNKINRTPYNQKEKDLLIYEKHDLRRCTKCILPETFPNIKFDNDGVCNYCSNHKSHRMKGTKEEFIQLAQKYKKNEGFDCVVPFSGGRDSCFVLNFIVNELKMNPITYTYDWGMVTELATRNISVVSEKLNVPNITIGADFSKKRRNIRKNFQAWLKKPDLGMLNLLTAGDKHFFKYINDVKQITGTSLNIWGTNALETTFFKAGFLGVKPYFEDTKVYTTGFKKQLKYQLLRLKKMFINPRYFNRSIFDTLSGEYYRSFSPKSDYFHLFDYISWNENIVEETVFSLGFEKAIDTNTTWRIGDGTAGIYNYIYYKLAGFTENDTFRSNQIREGLMTREEAMQIIEIENEPKYENIRWYLDMLEMDFSTTINRINEMKPLFRREK